MGITLGNIFGIANKTGSVELGDPTIAGIVKKGGAPPFEYTAIENNYSMTFDGTSGYVVAPIPGDAFKFATIRSFSFWVKTTSTSLQPLFSGIGPTSSLFRYTNQLYYKTDNRLLWSYDSSPIYGSVICQAQTTDPIIINDGNWHHIVLYAPVDSNANRNNISNAKIYVDGEDLALTTNPGTADIRGFQSTGETQIVLGAGNSGGSTAQIYLDGNIDEFAYWDNLELSEPTVQAIYNTTNDNPGKAADLSETPEGAPIAWYRFE